MKKISIISLVFFVMFALITPTSLAEETNVNDIETNQSIEINGIEDNQQAVEEETSRVETETETEIEVKEEVEKSTDVSDATVSENPVSLSKEITEIVNYNVTPLSTTIAKIGSAEYSTLKEAIDAATDGDVIVLVDSAKLFAPIVLDKSITIKSETETTRFEISADATFDKSGSNQTLFTAMSGVILTLNNISVNSAPKYGVQAYSGSTVVIDGVDFKDNSFGGILVNGGKVIFEGAFSITGNSDSGIELAKGSMVTTEPSIEFKGAFNTTLSSEKFIYIDKSQITEMSDTLITVSAGSGYEILKTNSGFVLKKDGQIVATPSLPNGKILVSTDGSITTGFDTLGEAFKSAPEGSILILQDNMDVTAPIIVDKKMSLDGNGKTLKATYAGGSGNQSILTFTTASTVSNVTIQDSPKYGVQVFGANAVVTMQDVQFENNAYGAILINGGTAQVSDVKFVGQSTGIEIGRGSDTTTSSNLEILGEITADNAKKAIYIDLNQVVSVEQSKITSTFYDVATNQSGLITLTKNGTVAFEVAGNIRTVTPSVPNNTTNTTTWDDGGPFTTDRCGSIFDRWGNELYKAPSCSVPSGYQVPNTAVK